MLRPNTITQLRRTTRSRPNNTNHKPYHLYTKHTPFLKQNQNTTTTKRGPQPTRLQHTRTTPKIRVTTHTTSHRKIQHTTATTTTSHHPSITYNNLHTIKHRPTNPPANIQKHKPNLYTTLNHKHSLHTKNHLTNRTPPLYHTNRTKKNKTYRLPCLYLILNPQPYHRTTSNQSPSRNPTTTKPTLTTRTQRKSHQKHTTTNPTTPQTQYHPNHDLQGQNHNLNLYNRISNTKTFR